MTDPRLAPLPTPCLLIDEARMKRNIDRLSARAARLGVSERPLEIVVASSPSAASSSALSTASAPSAPSSPAMARRILR